MSVNAGTSIGQQTSRLVSNHFGRSRQRTGAFVCIWKFTFAMCTCLYAKLSVRNMRLFSWCCVGVWESVLLQDPNASTALMLIQDLHVEVKNLRSISELYADDIRSLKSFTSRCSYICVPWLFVRTCVSSVAGLRNSEAKDRNDVELEIWNGYIWTWLMRFILGLRVNRLQNTVPVKMVQDQADPAERSVGGKELTALHETIANLWKVVHDLGQRHHASLISQVSRHWILFAFFTHRHGLINRVVTFRCHNMLVVGLYRSKIL